MLPKDIYKFYNSKYINRYGPKTILFLKVGYFYEFYHLNKSLDIKLLQSSLNLTPVLKYRNEPISEKNYYMMGFPIITSHKFIDILYKLPINTVIIETDDYMYTEKYININQYIIPKFNSFYDLTFFFKN